MTTTVSSTVHDNPADASIMALPSFHNFDLRTDGNVGPRWKNGYPLFDHLMTAINISDPVRMRALLLHYAGHEIDEIFDTLTVQEATDDVNVYQTASKPLTTYFNPKTSTAYEIYNFRQATH